MRWPKLKLCDGMLPAGCNEQTRASTSTPLPTFLLPNLQRLSFPAVKTRRSCRDLSASLGQCTPGVDRIHISKSLAQTTNSPSRRRTSSHSRRMKHRNAFPRRPGINDPTPLMRLHHFHPRLQFLIAMLMERDGTFRIRGSLAMCLRRCHILIRMDHRRLSIWQGSRSTCLGDMLWDHNHDDWTYNLVGMGKELVMMMERMITVNMGV